MSITPSSLPRLRHCLGGAVTTIHDIAERRSWPHV